MTDWNRSSPFWVQVQEIDERVTVSWCLLASGIWEGQGFKNSQETLPGITTCVAETLVTPQPCCGPGIWGPGSHSGCLGSLRLWRKQAPAWKPQTWFCPCLAQSWLATHCASLNPMKISQPVTHLAKHEVLALQFCVHNGTLLPVLFWCDDIERPHHRREKLGLGLSRGGSSPGCTTSRLCDSLLFFLSVSHPWLSFCRWPTHLSLLLSMRWQTHLSVTPLSLTSSLQCFPLGSQPGFIPVWVHRHAEIQRDPEWRRRRNISDHHRGCLSLRTGSQFFPSLRHGCVLFPLITVISRHYKIDKM